MKICLVSDYLPYIHNTWSGAELVCSKLGELLKTNGHEISFITLKDGQNRTKDIFFVKSLFRKLPFIAKNFIVDTIAFLSVMSIIRKIKPDIIHIQAKFLFFPTAISALLLRIPYLFTVLDYYILCPRNMLLRPKGELCVYNHGLHCSDCFSLSDRGIMKLVDRSIPKVFKKFLCVLRQYSVDYFMNRASKVITFSQTSKDRLLNYGYEKNKVEVIYHYQFETANSSNNPYGKKILFVGSLTEHKGLHIIIEAMKDVVEQIPDVKLVVVGEGKSGYLTYIKGLIKKYSLGGYIDFLWRKDNRNVLKLIKEVDVVVVPEQWYSEFGPVILIEAKLSGKPVVASRIGSIPEYIRDGLDGILATYNNSDEFSQAIIRLLKNHEFANKIGVSISDSIKNITNTKEMLEDLEKLYQGSKR